MTQDELKLMKQLVGEIQKLTMEVSKIKEALRNISNNGETPNRHLYRD